MQSTPSPPPQTGASTALPFSVRLVAFAALAAGWIGWLSWLTLTTSNPPVVNRVQIMASDLVFLGHWTDRAKGKLNVVREMKRGEPQGAITVELVPKQRSAADDNGEWIVPVRRTRTGYAVTSGKFINRPELAGDASVPVEVVVEPQIYPATERVLKQIDDLLPKAVEARASR